MNNEIVKLVSSIFSNFISPKTVEEDKQTIYSRFRLLGKVLSVLHSVTPEPKFWHNLVNSINISLISFPHRWLNYRSRENVILSQIRIQEIGRSWRRSLHFILLNKLELFFWLSILKYFEMEQKWVSLFAWHENNQQFW